MTRGRGAKGWDMALPGTPERLGRSRVTCAPVGGNAGENELLWAEEIAASGRLLPGAGRASRQESLNIIWVFHHGTALAEMKFRAQSCGLCWSCAMLLALALLRSAIDAAARLDVVEAGTVRRQQPEPAPICSPSRRMPRPRPARLRLRRRARCSPISPETMSALLAAQSQASQGATVAPTSRADALKDLFAQDRRRRRRQDHQERIRKSARRRRHQPRAGRRRLRQARQERRRLGLARMRCHRR